MSSQKFESLDEDIKDLLDKVSKRLQNGISRKDCDEERKRVITKLEGSLDEAKKILNKMVIESRQAPSKFQYTMRTKINECSNEIQRHCKRLNEERYTNVGSHMGNNSLPYNNSSDLQDHMRKQILLGTSSLERTSESLARSHTIAIETEQIGTEVLGELGTQREALQRTRDRLENTQEEISRTRKILRTMGRNFLYNKLLLIIIILLEVLIFAGLVYWKFFT